MTKTKKLTRITAPVIPVAHSVLERMAWKERLLHAIALEKEGNLHEDDRKLLSSLSSSWTTCAVGENAERLRKNREVFEDDVTPRVSSGLYTLGMDFMWQVRAGGYKKALSTLTKITALAGL